MLCCFVSARPIFFKKKQRKTRNKEVASSAVGIIILIYVVVVLLIVVLKQEPNLFLNPVVMLVFTLLVEKKICFTGESVYREE
jgi:glycopeptide antibiotics resistance protein